MSKKMNTEVKLIVENANEMLRTKLMQNNKHDRETITSHPPFNSIKGKAGCEACEKKKKFCHIAGTSFGYSR